jgi:hypothetical protein
VLALTLATVAACGEQGRLPLLSTTADVHEAERQGFTSPASHGAGVRLTYFPPTYDEGRRRFLAHCDSLQERLFFTEQHRIPVKSAVDDDLSIDVCHILPSQEASKLVVLLTGVNGVEGNWGSAVLELFFREVLSSLDLSNTGIALVHAVNPFGYKYERRATENNVDLNRNFGLDPALFESENASYEELYWFLNPRGRVDIWSADNLAFFAEVSWHALRMGAARLRQATVQGQYDYESGIYFGGSEFEPQVGALQTFFAELFREYQDVMAFDLHTGYGERGTMHLFGDPVANKQEQLAADAVFAGYPVERAVDEGHFYTITGDVLVFVGQMLPPGASYLPMALEFGTMDTQTLLGAVRCLQYARLENQGYHFGYASADDEAWVRAKYRDIYRPSSPQLRQTMLDQSYEMLTTFIPRFTDLRLQ